MGTSYLFNLDEMEKEIEIQVETEIEIEQEVERPAVKYFTNHLDKEVEEFVKNGIFDYGSTCFKKLITSLNESSVYNLVEIEAWSNYMYTSRDFSKKIRLYASKKGYKLNDVILKAYTGFILS